MVGGGRTEDTRVFDKLDEIGKMLDLESEVMTGPGSIPTRGNILPLDFFHVVKPLVPILALLPILSICEKPDRNRFVFVFPFITVFLDGLETNKIHDLWTNVDRGGNLSIKHIITLHDNRRF